MSLGFSLPFFMPHIQPDFGVRPSPRERSMSDKITSMMREGLTFPPPASITANADVSSLEQYHELWNRAKNDPQSFWDNEAKKLAWDKPYDRVLEWNEPLFLIVFTLQEKVEKIKVTSKAGANNSEFKQKIKNIDSAIVDTK